jgi:hypothetical protein
MKPFDVLAHISLEARHIKRVLWGNGPGADEAFFES